MWALVKDRLAVLEVRLLRNALLFGALWGVGLALGLVLPSVLPVVVAALVWLGVAGWAATEHEAWFDGWGLLLMSIPVIMTSMSSRAWLALALATPSPLVTLDAEPAGPVVELPQDAVARVDLAYTHTTTHRSKSGGTTTSRWTVAPLVPAGWTSEQPVSAWFGCAQGVSLSCDRPPQRARLGVVLRSWDTESFIDAAAAACTARGLSCREPPLILEGASSMEEAIADERFAVFGSFFIGFGAWAVPRVVYDLVDLLRALWRAWRG